MKKFNIVKLLASIFVFVVAFFISLDRVDAANGIITSTIGARLREGTSIYTTQLVVVPYNYNINIIETVNGDSRNCASAKWHKTTYLNYTGYICANIVRVVDSSTPNPSPDNPPASGEVIYGEVTTENGRIYNGPGTSYSYYWTLHKSHNDPAFYINKYVDSEGGCSSNKWAHITYIRTNGQIVYGYMCSENFKVTDKVPLGPNPYQETNTENDMSKMTDEQFEAYLTAQGFTEPYKVKLRALHKKHPTWIFKGFIARDTLEYGVFKEDDPTASRSLIQRNNNDGYLSTHEISYNWYTNVFKVKDSGSFYNANAQTIRYYMNPLNWLDEKNVFYFEDMRYHPATQKIEGVLNILAGTNMHQYANHYMEAAQVSGVSPLFLASLSRQELGFGTGPAISGTAVGPAGCGSGIAGVSFAGFYNFYNIGATSGTCPVYRGLITAKNRGWNSPRTAIIEGAKWIAGSYIARGQTTLYSQKWDLYGYSKQYMQNISAQISPANKTFESYRILGLLEIEKVFEIPIFRDVTTTSSLPPKGNPNNYLNNLQIDNQTIAGFDGGKTAYTITVPASLLTVNIKASTVANTASIISGLGNVALKDTTVVNVLVRAANLTTRTYTITIKKEKELTPPPVVDDPVLEPPLEPDAPLVSPQETITKAGYKLNANNVYGFTYGLSIASIETKLRQANPNASIKVSSNSSKTVVSNNDLITIENSEGKVNFRIVLYGDLNSDGVLNMLDIIRIQRHLNKDSILTNTHLLAADTNRDGKVNILDIIFIQRQILGDGNIVQN